MNNISAYASIDLNLDVRCLAFAKHVRKTLEEIITNNCIRITSEHHIKTNKIFKQFIRWFSYQCIRTVLIYSPSILSIRISFHIFFSIVLLLHANPTWRTGLFAPQEYCLPDAAGNNEKQIVLWGFPSQ